MNPLPAPIADPLHVLPPASLLALMALAGLVLLLLALLVLRRLGRRSRPAAATPIPPPPVPADVPTAGIGDRIAAIERKFTRSKRFRDGCHALAAAVKQHLAQATGLGVEEMTSAEIAERLGDARVGRFMTGLSRRRYGRREPRRRDFGAACHEARELLA